MPPIRGLIDKGSGTGRAAVTSPPTLFTSFAVPHEGRGLRVPAGDRLLEPHDDLGGGLRMVSVQGAAHDMRWRASARLSHEPLTGVYSGTMPC